MENEKQNESQVVGSSALQLEPVTQPKEEQNENESFAIQTELNLQDLMAMADILRVSVERGAWKIEELELITLIYKKLAKLLKEHEDVIKQSQVGGPK